MKNVSIRFPDELHERIKTVAEPDRRSFNAEVLALIEEALQVRDSPVPTTPAARKPPPATK